MLAFIPKGSPKINQGSQGQTVLTTSQTFIVPANVKNLCAVAVGPAGTKGGNAQFGYPAVYVYGGGGGGFRITTTESKQRALFSNPTVVQGDVLALTIGGRFSSLEQSALEALGAAKLTLKSNGQFHQTEAISIPKQSFVKTTEYLEKSPFTGSTWTADEVNNMLFGVEIVVDPKNVS